MKQLLYSIIFFLITFQVQGQITITNADMPGSGDTIRYSEVIIDSLTLATYQQGGANVTWDFSQMVATSQGLYDYKSSLQTPYAFFFLGFNKYGRLEQDSIGLGAFQFNEIYSFYANSSSSFDAEGVGLKFQGFPVPAYYTDNDEIYQFPLSYNDLDSSTFSFNLSLLAFGGYESSGYRINQVDGWGQITTPFGTFNCIRLVSDVVASDSIAFNGIKFGFPNVTREYKWLANGEKMPILEVSGNVTAGAFTPTTVRYRDSFRNVASNPIGNVALPADFDANNVTPSTLDTVTFSTNLGAFATHNWTFTPNTITFVNGTDASSAAPEVLFNTAGLYDVGHTVSNFIGTGDTTKIAYISVSNPVGTVNLTTIFDAKVFPNPVSDVLNVTYQLEGKSDVTLTIFDIQGKQVANLFNATQAVGEHNHTFKIQPLNLAKGVYVLRMSIDGQEQLFQFIK